MDTKEINYKNFFQISVKELEECFDYYTQLLRMKKRNGTNTLSISIPRFTKAKRV